MELAVDAVAPDQDRLGPVVVLGQAQLVGHVRVQLPGEAAAGVLVRAAQPVPVAPRGDRDAVERYRQRLDDADDDPSVEAQLEAGDRTVAGHRVGVFQVHHVRRGALQLGAEFEAVDAPIESGDVGDHVEAAVDE